MATDWSQFQPIAEPVPQAPLPTAGGTDWSQFEPVEEGEFANVQSGSASVPMAQFASDQPIGDAAPDWGTTPQAEAAALTGPERAPGDTRHVFGPTEGILRTAGEDIVGMLPSVALATNPLWAAGNAAYRKLTGNETPVSQLEQAIHENVGIDDRTMVADSPLTNAMSRVTGHMLSAAVPLGPAGEAANAARAGHLGPEIQGAQVADDILASAKPAVKPRVRIGEDGRPVSVDTLDVPTETPPAIAGAAPEAQATDTAASVLGEPGQAAETPRPLETSNKKAVINAERRARGAAEMDFEGRRTFGDAWDKARAKYEAEGADDLARDYAKNPRPLSTEDNARLAIHRHDLNAERREAVHEAAAAQDAGDVEALERARAKLDNIDDNLEIADRAARQSIGETAHSLGSTRMMTRDDYTPGEALLRAKVSKGEALTPKEKARVEKRGAEIEAEYAKRDEAIRKARPKVSKAAQAEFDSIAERIKTMPRDKLCQV